jgi:hypothetical protein
MVTLTKPVTGYTSAAGNFQFVAPDDWPNTPVNGDPFVIYAIHVHPIPQIRDAILADSTPFNGADIPAILAMLDDPRTEPGQGAPAVNPDAMTKLDYIYKAWRNKTEQTATTLSLYDDAGTTVDQKATVSDDATTATKGEIGAGP